MRHITTGPQHSTQCQNPPPESLPTVASCCRGVRTYTWKAELEQRPRAWIVESCKPAIGAVVAARYESCARKRGGTQTQPPSTVPEAPRQRHPSKGVEPSSITKNGPEAGPLTTI